MYLYLTLSNFHVKVNETLDLPPLNLVLLQLICTVHVRHIGSSVSVCPKDNISMCVLHMRIFIRTVRQLLASGENCSLLCAGSVSVISSTILPHQRRPSSLEPSEGTAAPESLLR